MTAYLATFKIVLEVEADDEDAAIELAERVVGGWESPLPSVSFLRSDLGDVEEDR